mmetsp:Transcript_25663/g.65300  ORF Transcript_25663/g.65300 Transcript_25663/m.65300 type:complete len:220 (-) Transcript_25663:2227-2886(-)
MSGRSRAATCASRKASCALPSSSCAAERKAKACASRDCARKALVNISTAFWKSPACIACSPCARNSSAFCCASSTAGGACGPGVSSDRRPRSAVWASPAAPRPFACACLPLTSDGLESPAQAWPCWLHQPCSPPCSLPAAWSRLFQPCSSFHSSHPDESFHDPLSQPLTLSQPLPLSQPLALSQPFWSHQPPFWFAQRSSPRPFPERRESMRACTSSLA